MVAQVPAGAGAGAVADAGTPAEGAAAAVAPASPQAQGWPARSAAYYGLFVIILATALNFLDLQMFSMMAPRIKADFHLSDEQLGFLLGPANIIFFLLVGIPLGRLADKYPRKYVLAGGITLTGGITALGGLAQNFVQLFMSRMLVGAGGSAHAPGSYSMLADYFPPARLPRAIGFLQLGFISGNVLGFYLGGVLLTMVAAWPVTHWMGLTIHGWQWVLMMVGAPGFLVAALLLCAQEPRRRGLTGEALNVPMMAVLREIWTRRGVYLPLFIGLAFSATEFLGLQVWRPTFLARTYGWSPQRIGNWMSVVVLVSWLAGAFVGTVFTERLAKRYRDANVRATAILFALIIPFEVAAPLMPSGELSLLCVALGGVCGLASAVPQNAAIQRITPNAMRGRVTAIYLFMFSFGYFGAQLIGSVTHRVFGSDADLWKSIVLTASILLPLAAFTISRGVEPYGREVERLEKLEAQGA